MSHFDPRPDTNRRSGRAGRRPTDDALTDKAFTDDTPTDGASTDDDLTDDDLTDDGLTDDEALDDAALDDAADSWVDPDRLDGAAMARWWRSQRRRRGPDPDLDVDLDLDVELVRPRGGRRREPPLPLRRAVRPADPFPVEALGPDLAAAARAVQARTLAPLALCGQAVLGAAALAAQAHADVALPDGRQCPLSLALLSVAAPGERLGVVMDVALRAVRREECRLRATHAVDLAAYHNERAAWRAARRVGRERDRATLRALLDAAGPEPAPPGAPALLLRAPSLDGLLGVLASGPPGLGLVDPAPSPFIAGPGLSRPARRRMARALARLWDDGSAERPRARDAGLTLHDKRLSLHFAATPGEDLVSLTAPGLADDGLFSRLLCVMPASTIGTRVLGDDSDARVAATQADMDRFEARIAGLLRTAPRTAGRQPLTLAPGAVAPWRDFGNALETAVTAGRDPDCSGAVVGLAAEQVARLAGVLTVFADSGAAEIPAAAIADAIDLVLHYLDEADRIAGLAGETVAVHRAQEVLDYIQQLGRPVVHLAEIYQRGPYAVRDVAAARAALRLLDDHGYVERLWNGTMVDGLRRREAWKLIVADPAKAAKVATPPTSVTVPAARTAASATLAAVARAARPADPAKAAKVTAPPASARAIAAQPLAGGERSARRRRVRRPRQTRDASPEASPARSTPPHLPPVGPDRQDAPRARRESSAPRRSEVRTEARPTPGDRPTASPAEPPGDVTEGAKVAATPASPAVSPAAVAKAAKVPAPPATALARLMAQLASAGPPPVSEAGAGSVDPGSAGVPPAPERAADPPPQVAADITSGAASLDADGVPLAWTEGVARLDPRAPPPDFTARQWSAFVEVCGRLLADHGRALHATGWTAPEIFGFHPRAPWRALEIAGLALFLVATPGAWVVEIRPDGMIYDKPGPGSGPYWRTRPRRSGVAAWLLAPQPRPPSGRDDRR